MRRAADAAKNPMKSEEQKQLESSAQHFDHGKTRLDLIPVKPLALLGQVCAMGCDKYGEQNWRKGMKWSKLLGSAMRHIESFRGGESVDPESGLPHLSHAVWNLMALTEYYLSSIGEDDRVFQLDGMKYSDLKAAEVVEVAIIEDQGPATPAKVVENPLWDRSDLNPQWGPLMTNLRDCYEQVDFRGMDDAHLKATIKTWMNLGVYVPLTPIKAASAKMDLKAVRDHIKTVLNTAPVEICDWLGQGIYLLSKDEHFL